ncbi:hypothetical protein A2U01_0073570, partial [Trifolium medium]|nr:hypothetical protein [Trifolium medium]
MRMKKIRLGGENPPSVMWSEIRFLTHAYGENSIGREELTLCAPQIPRRRLVIANNGGNFVP